MTTDPMRVRVTGLWIEPKVCLTCSLTSSPCDKELLCLSDKFDFHILRSCQISGANTKRPSRQISNPIQGFAATPLICLDISRARRDTSNETLSTNLVESAFLLLSAWRIVHVRSRDPYSEYWLPRSTLVLPVAVDGAAMQNEFPSVAAAANATTAELSRWERFSSRFHMRPAEDDEPQSWWIASTAIPLVAATTGPLANVMSIVALVMPWRNTIISRDKGPTGTWVQEGYNDPHW